MSDLHDIAIGAAIAQTRGEITFQEFQRTLAWCSLVAQDVDEPTVEQIAARCAELDTAASFISAVPAPAE